MVKMAEAKQSFGHQKGGCEGCQNVMVTSKDRFQKDKC